MTIHEESMRQLCVGADYQQGIADKAQARAEDLARRVGPAEERLNNLRKQAERAKQDLDAMRAQLAEEQRAAMHHGRLAADFLALAVEQCEVNGWDMPVPAAPEPPRSAEQIRAAAVDDLTEPPFNVTNIICVCPERCPVHGGGPGNGRAEALSRPEPTEDTQPDPAPERSETRAVRTPRALLLALYVRLVLLGDKGEGRHVRQRRVFKRRALVEVV